MWNVVARYAIVAVLAVTVAACTPPQQLPVDEDDDDDDPIVAMCDDPSDQPILDAALAAAIREALGTTSGPTCGDLLDLEVLGEEHAANRDIETLEGLEHARNLRELWVQGNLITSIDVLADIPALRTVAAYGNPLTSIEALRGLDDLHAVFLGWHDQYIDPSPLEGKADLVVLHFQGAELTSLDFLAASTDLSDIAVGWNELTDVSILATMPSLAYVFLRTNAITDISFVDDLPLVLLDVSHNHGVDLTPVAAKTTIEILGIGDTGVDDLSFLAGFTDLAVLGAYMNPIVEPPAAAVIANLVHLDVGGTDLSDLSFVAGIPLGLLSAWGLDLVDGDIAVVAGLDELEYLDLSGNLLTEIGPVVANTSLGAGDYVNLEWNCLDLTPGSQAADDVDALLARGVDVRFETQRDVCP